MKLPSGAVFTFIATLSISAFGGEGWLVDFEQAKAQAASEKKILLMDFTGSDWCEYCIRLKNEVFSTELFKTTAPKSFVLMELDFPQNESKISPQTRAQNEALQQTYAIEGYPTLILADASGRPFARTGYRKGGAEEYMKHLSSLQSILEKRDAAFEKAAPLSGLDKAKGLKEALATIPEEMVAAHYQHTLNEIRTLDKDDTLGMNAKFGFSQSLSELRARMSAKIPEGGEAVRAEADKMVGENPKWDARQKQKALMYTLNFLMRPKDDRTALKLVQDVKALAPETEEGKIAESIRAQLDRSK